MKPVMMTPNRASAHNHRGGTVRNFKRLFPVFLVAILLAGVALARPAGVIRPNGQLAAVAKSQFRPAYDNARLNFGTVVRDTADDQSIEPGRRQVQPQVPMWTSLFNWSWVSFLIQR
jgi:hypothetical protein